MGLGLAKVFNNIVDRTAEVIGGAVAARSKNIEVRQQERSYRNDAKVDGRKVAYQNGFDPQAAKWAGISGIGSSISGAFSNIFGFGFSPGGRGEAGYVGVGGGSGSGSGNTMVLIIVLVIIVSLMGVNRRR